MTKTVAKLFAAFFIALTALAGFAPAAGAQSELLFGQSHYYSVVFRGNGEAIVYARLVIPNPGDTPLADLSFEVPSAVPTEMAIYQTQIPVSCARYAPVTPGMPLDSSSNCLEYNAPNPDGLTPDYYGNYRMPIGQSQYKKVDFTNVGNLYKFTLPQPIVPYKTTTVVVAYAAKGYVTDSFGLFKFNFETLKVPSRISTLQVAVDVDSDLILKGKKAVVNYAVPATATATGLGLAAGKADISSQEFNNTVSSIGSYGAMVKTAKNLSPNESFTVKGEYSASWWRLNLFAIVLTVLIIVLIIVGIYFLARFMKRKHKKAEPSAPKAIWAANDWINVTNAWVSFASVGIMMIVSWLLPNLTRLLDMVYDPMVSIVIALATVLFFAIAIFAPGIIVATRRHSWRSFVAILIAELIWLVIFLIIYFVLFRSGAIANPSPVPMMY
jgi:hypothetical protein